MKIYKFVIKNVYYGIKIRYVYILINFGVLKIVVKDSLFNIYFIRFI